MPSTHSRIGRRYCWKVKNRIRSKKLVMIEAVVQEAEVKLASSEQHIAELKDVGVKHLTLAAPLLNRKEATVIAAASKLFARYRTLQVPILRIKTDRAKEFVFEAIQGVDNSKRSGALLHRWRRTHRQRLRWSSAEECNTGSPTICWIAHPGLAYST